MNRKWKSWKKWTGIALALLVLADGALAGYLWQAGREGPEEMRAQRDRLAAQVKLLKADVARGEKIRASLPQVKKDCDAFYSESFLDRITGYSDIETDLDSIAAKAGVKTTGFSFKQKQVKDRSVTEISIGTSVDADYPAVIQFINGLERSKYFYLIDDLQLSSASTGMIRLQIGLHTYFRAWWMSRRTQTYLLAGLAIVLGVVVYNAYRGQSPADSGVLASDSKFQPLDVQEPRLHTELLEKLRNLEYSGTHRNIFVAVPPSPEQGGAAQQAPKPAEPFVGPRQPPPPPPLQVPAEFFGYAIRSASGRRVAFFTSGDDVLVVAEGDTLLGRFRLVHIGNDSADVEEVATGRHTTVPMVQPPAEQAGIP